MGEGETDREIAALEDSSSRKRKRNAAEDAAFEWIRKGCACARDGQTEREREREGEKLRRWVVELSIHSAHPSPPTRSGLCAFESRGSRGFPGEDVHRFLSSDRPFEQQPTWKTETRLSVCTVCTPSASLSFPFSL